MQRSEIDRVVSEIRSFFDQDTTKMAPTEGFHPASTYADAGWARREEKMLRSHPMILGHSSQLPEAGDYRTDDTAGVPVLLARQSDGSLKAFLNICRHRGARLCPDADSATGRL